MRRLDTLLVVVVGAFGIFVARQVTTARHAAAKTPAKSAQVVEAESKAEPSRAVATAPPSSVPLGDAAPARDARRDVPGTYFSDMVTDLEGQLVRWPDRSAQGLRIWVQSTSDIRDWNLGYAQMARDAFDDWGTAGLPLRFDFILDSATADIHILWNEQFAPEQGQRVGSTLRTSDGNGWLTSARILVAIHDSTGRAIPPGSLAGIVRHEAGHALGLGHSNDPRTKMFPMETVDGIMAPDRATLKLLYEFPPGRVR